MRGPAVDIAGPFPRDVPVKELTGRRGHVSRRRGAIIVIQIILRKQINVVKDEAVVIFIEEFFGCVKPHVYQHGAIEGPRVTLK